MHTLKKAYRIFNLLSLDVALGAVSGACYFAIVLDVVVRPYALASLGLTVWIIYTADHLMDARKVKGQASTERHRFHQEHFTSLNIALIMAAAIDFVLIFFIKRPVVYGGFLMLALIGLYLVLHRRLNFLKEVVVATLYCSGILLPSITVTNTDLMTKHYLLIIVFFTTALINLLMFSWFDRQSDLRDKHKSFVTTFGDQRTLRFVLALFVLNMILCLYDLFITDQKAEILVPVAMNVVLILILRFEKWFALRDRYRLLGDAVFLFPFLFVLLKK